ncbi:hypothetical protein CA260_17935 [Dyella jiangningensis]|uniref:Uncharacterized protein n=1 Tax=Dyella jiangningensis TaxID=1379159 RepID=A0A328P117_9GAMM|nr:hypothetical protein CA260_17935 [Dyella jiangningensis]
MVNLDYWISQPWVQLLCFIVFTSITAKGLRTGSATLVYQTYKRSEDPELYWAGIVLSALAAASMLLLLVHGLTNWPDI